MAHYDDHLPKRNTTNAVDGIDLAGDFHRIVASDKSLADVYMVTSQKNFLYIREFNGTSWTGPVTVAINKTEAHFSYPVDYTVTIPVVGQFLVMSLVSVSH